MFNGDNNLKVYENYVNATIIFKREREFHELCKACRKKNENKIGAIR